MVLTSTLSLVPNTYIAVEEGGGVYLLHQIQSETVAVAINLGGYNNIAPGAWVPPGAFVVETVAPAGAFVVETVAPVDARELLMAIKDPSAPSGTPNGGQP